MPRAASVHGSRSRARQKRTSATAITETVLRRSELLFPLMLLACVAAAGVWWFKATYSVVFRSPITVQLQSPVVITQRITGEEAAAAEFDQQGRHLSGWQQYACRKFGASCRLALAIQRAENAAGACEIYHYNSDGSLDWGYFQINTVHLQRPDLNLRDLLDCKANIDFAYKLYLEHGGFSPWSTFKSGAYRRFLSQP